MAENVIFAKQTLLLEETQFTSAEIALGMGNDVTVSENFRFVPGEVYVICFDGKEYTCTAIDASNIVPGYVVVGNASDFDFPSNDEPFGIVWDDTMDAITVVCLEDMTSNTHTISIYQAAEEWSVTVLKEQDISGFTIDEAIVPATTPLIANKTYTVMWDGEPYTCTAYNMQVSVDGNGNPVYSVFLGNRDGVEWLAGGQVGDMPELVEPFALSYVTAEKAGTTTDIISIMCAGTLFGTCLEDTHRVGISLVVDEDDPVSYRVLFPERSISGFFSNPAFGGVYTRGFNFGTSIPAFTINQGETYQVLWDGTWWPVVAEDASAIMEGCLFLGNGSMYGLSGNGEPFAIGSDAQGITFFSVNDTSDAHTIAIRQAGDSNVVVEEQTLTLAYVPDMGLSAWTSSYGLFGFVDGQSYRVVYNDIEYGPLIAYTYVDEAAGGSSVMLGNGGIVGVADDADVSFLLFDDLSGSGGCGVFELGEVGSCKLAVYIVREEPEDPDEPDEPENPDDPDEPSDAEEGIVLKDRNGNDVKYYGIETVTFDTTTKGKQQVYTKGVAVDNLEIVPDFSEGDMAVNAPAGVLVKSAIIQKPADLSPENVRKGKSIAGIDGDFIGDTEEVTVELNMAEGDQEITPSAPGKVLSHVVVNKPISLTPMNIAEGINIAGVTGTYKGADENATQIVSGTSMANMFRNALFFNSPITIANTVTNMSYAFYACNNFNQPVNIPAKVTNLAYAFYACNSLNKPVSISNRVTNMCYAFGQCKIFNQPITISGSVRDASCTFYQCYNFNQPVTIENGVTALHETFYVANTFNQPVTIPDSVQTMRNTFASCRGLNQPVIIGNGVTNMYMAFNGCWIFNQPVTIPNSVSNMCYAFSNCYNLRGPVTIGSGATNLGYTFTYCNNISDITILSTKVTNVRSLVQNKWNNVRLNITVPAGSTTNTTIARNDATSVTGAIMYWTTDAANNCIYDSSRNIYIYWV